MTQDKLAYFVGLDIGTTAVRCVVGELGPDSATPSIIAATHSPNSGMRKGNIAHVDEVAEAVTAAVTEAERTSGREIRAATINVNGAHVEGLNSKGVIAISSADRQITHEDRQRVEEAATIVALPANKDIIQVFAKNYRLDSQDNIKDPVGMQGVRLEVDTHILTASIPALRSLEQVLDKAELRPSHRTVTSLASAEVLLDRKQRESGVAVLDIGAATTNVIVIEDGEVEHVAVVPMGGTHVTNDLAIGLKTELEIAELVKVKHASLDPRVSGETSFVHGGQELRFDRETVRMVAQARIEEIFEYVDKEFKAIRRSRKLPGGIVLTGGGSKLPGIVEVAKDSFELPARLGKWSHIKKVVGDFDDATFTPAVGLMLLDMLLGPVEAGGYSDNQPGWLGGFNLSLNDLVRRFRRR
ncbi:cell division protein FtsA [Candidatus Saccharibacteria bacterium]|nr:cell division protein FtsA [Candidatus Saccharibacteria bacterium]